MPENLQQWLSYLEALQPSRIELGLDRIRRVAERLALYPFPKKAITVAGTNGKGSCVILLETILLKAGYQIGSYISPHLFSFTERIRFNGSEVPETLLCYAFERVLHAQEDIDLTYFEFTTLAALYLFAEQDLDLIILEVGLGGRLDAVNIVDPLISVITSIGLDHTEWLGETREKIAQEKLGICRTGIPLVCGEQNFPLNIVHWAFEQRIPLYLRNRDFYWAMQSSRWSFYSENFVLENLPYPKILLENAATVLMTLRLICDFFPVSCPEIEAGLQEVFLPGRLEKRVDQGKSILVDVSHNPHGVQVLADYLLKNPIKGRNFAVFNMLAYKDIDPVITIMKPWIYQWNIAPFYQEKGYELTILREKFHQEAIENVHATVSFKQAYQDAISVISENDRLIIFGSFHVVADCFSDKN